MIPVFVTDFEPFRNRRQTWSHIIHIEEEQHKKAAGAADGY